MNTKIKERKEGVMGLEQIKNFLPHRENWLLVKEVLSLNEENILAKTWFEKDLCRGHFPQSLVVPGQLLAEAMVQTGALLILIHSKIEGLPILIRENIIFKGFVLPKEVIEIKVKLTKEKMGLYFFEGEIKKEEKIIVKGDFVGKGQGEIF